MDGRAGVETLRPGFFVRSCSIVAGSLVLPLQLRPVSPWRVIIR
jgi:hypothetical protein